jgi:hypothetical protein
MRYGCATFVLLISSAVMASAQEEVLVSARASAVDSSVRLHTLATQFERTDVRVSPDQIVARLMTFDRNGDGKVATAELSERMQVIVPRGDTSGDGALDDSELRALTARKLEFVSLALQNRQFGGYGFGDSVGLLSTRSHIHNTIDDLRLTSEANEQARRIASTFVDQLENAACLTLRGALAPLLTEQQFVELERTLVTMGAGGCPILPGEIQIPCGFCRVTGSDGTSTPTSAVAAARTLLERYQLTPDQIKAATVAVESFKTDRQLDDAHRSALVAQLAYVLTGEESENFRAALARRPVVKTPGLIGGVVGSVTIGTTSSPIRSASPASH